MGKAGPRRRPETLSGMKRFLRALFRPDWRCLSCGDEIFAEGKYFCPRCEEKLPYHTVICDRCGRAVPVAQSYCYECKNQLTEVDRARSAFSYEPPVSGLIQSFKYRNRRYLAEAFASALARVYFSQCEVCDLMVFVPMTRRRERERGYNQTALFGARTVRAHRRSPRGGGSRQDPGYAAPGRPVGGGTEGKPRWQLPRSSKKRSRK